MLLLLLQWNTFQKCVKITAVVDQLVVNKTFINLFPSYFVDSQGKLLFTPCFPIMGDDDVFSMVIIQSKKSGKFKKKHCLPLPCKYIKRPSKSMLYRSVMSNGLIESQRKKIVLALSLVRLSPIILCCILHDPCPMFKGQQCTKFPAAVNYKISCNLN